MMLMLRMLSALRGTRAHWRFTRLLAFLNLGIMSHTKVARLKQSARAQQKLDLLVRLNGINSSDLIRSLPVIHSQLGQDLLVLALLKFKTNGFFVEFGAADGVTHSNTFFLARSYSWKGILAEPASCYAESLIRERRGDSVIDTRCVSGVSGEIVEFCEAGIPELSTRSRYTNCDMHGPLRSKGKIYERRTVSMLDLLVEHGAPNLIDYLSIDTEGGELEILATFPFDQYQFKIITLEHNFSASRVKIYEKLTAHGYRRIMTDVSQFDDWYISESLNVEHLAIPPETNSKFF
jgi:hypothetical protein